MINSVKLSEVANYANGRINLNEINLDNYITTDNLLQNKLGVQKAIGLPPQNGFIPQYKKNDILVANIRPYLKKIWFADKDGGCSADVLVIRVKEDYIPKFIFYCLFRDDFFIHVMNGSKGTKMPRGDKNQILEFTIPKFEVQKQKNIAKVLSSLDEKIALNNRINQELEGMAKLLYDYWFVQFDFPISEEQAIAMGKPELKGKPYKSSGGPMVYNEQLKREIPEGWGVKELSNLVSYISRGISPKYLDEGGISVLNQKCIRHRTVDFKLGRRHDMKSKAVDPQKAIKICDVLINSTGVGTLGRTAVVKWIDEQMTTVDSHVTIVRPDIDKIDRFFFAYAVAEKQPEIEKFAEGSTGQVELGRALLSQLKMIIPNEKLQLKFSEFIKPIFGKMASNEKENQQLKELRDWLLPMLMNGQVRVSEQKDQDDLDLAAESVEVYGNQN